MFAWLNPWKTIRELKATLADRDYEIAYLQGQLNLHDDRYDKIRETNLQLRDALDLYRRSGM